MAKKKSAGCEYCSNYVYDEDYEYYVCDINLDEDEMARFMSPFCTMSPIFLTS